MSMIILLMYSNSELHIIIGHAACHSNDCVSITVVYMCLDCKATSAYN